jgi:hypothetical protein
MLDNRNRGRSLTARPRRLDTLRRIRNRGLGCALANFNPLQANIQSRIIHHREHCSDPRHFGADQVTSTSVIIAERKHARRRGMNAQLMLNRHTANVIAAAIGANFWH